MFGGEGLVGGYCRRWHGRVAGGVGDGVSCERRYFLASLSCDAARFAQAVSRHWGIENSLHWVLDVSFQEDDRRIRQDASAQTMSVLRHIALNLIRRESSHKRGMKARRKRARWTDAICCKS